MLESSEQEIQKSILEYLTLRRVFAWRNNSGAMPIESNGSKRFIRFGTIGSPDIFAIKDGKVYGLEVKKPKGKQSDGQVLFQEGMQKAGGIYAVVHSIDEVIALGL